MVIGGSIDPGQEKPIWSQRIANWRLIRAFLPRALNSCNRELPALKTDMAALHQELSRLEIPVVKVHGAKDRIVPVANIEVLERNLSGLGKVNFFSKMV